MSASTAAPTMYIQVNVVINVVYLELLELTQVGSFRVPGSRMWS